jgi:nucleotide-binding universal stress UspA family protein
MSESRDILFCTDFSEHANTAFDHAMDQARKYGARLHIFHVIMPSDPCGYSIGRDESSSESANGKGSTDSDEDLAQQAIGALKLKYLDLLNDSIREHEFIVKIGSPDVEVIEYATANDIDMIILGALGIPEKDRATRVRTAANVSKYAPCEVVVIQKRIQPAFGI